MCNLYVCKKCCTFLPKTKITSSAKRYNLNFRFMMKMGFFAVYTQKGHSSDLRSFTYCFRYKPHLIS